MKPSALEILRFLRRTRRYVGVREIFDFCGTNTPTKRVSELYRAGLIDKRRRPDDPRFVEYRARAMYKILLNERRTA